MSVIQDNSITTNSVEPASGQSLVLKKAGGTASITVATSGEATFAENIIVGTTGNGITFGGDPDSRINSPSVGSRTLDDYEEGYGSVSVTMSGSGSVTIGGVSSGYKYIKIGKIVHFSFEFQTTGVSSPVGTMRVALPFTIRSGMYYAGSLRMYREDFSANSVPILGGPASATYVEFITLRSGDTTGDITPTAGTRYHFGSITYECA